MSDFAVLSMLPLFQVMMHGVSIELDLSLISKVGEGPGGGESLHNLLKLKNLKLHTKYSSLKAFNYTIHEISP